MQCGTPVIASNTSSLPEVVGDAGILLDPHDMDGLCLAMTEVIINKELRAEMSRRALNQASRFSWERCVAETIAAYHDAVTAFADAPSTKSTRVA
jgi:glycosyltransferase involved in cell wall biosynthesis